MVTACYSSNLCRICRTKCSSVKTIHTNDHYQLFTNCPVHFAFARLTGHKQQAPYLSWHGCHAMLMSLCSRRTHITVTARCRSGSQVRVGRAHVELTSEFRCAVILSSPIEVYAVITVKIDHGLLARRCHVLFMLNMLFFFHPFMAKWLSQSTCYVAAGMEGKLVLDLCFTTPLCGKLEFQIMARSWD